ncbi:MAG: hypothetical protein K8H88_21000 [Sandaracinaceae bacterium]|nr:hypothetical protein [Sandaracinaceae bacterium]
MTDDNGDFDLEAALRGAGRPRDHHYAFAHMALPSVVFGLGPRVDLERMAAERAFFTDLWTEAGRAMGGELLPAEGLSAQYVRDGELDAVIVTMPQARFPVEAIMTAIVRRTTRRMLVFSRRELRYLTLEVGVTLTGDQAGRTVLGEWTQEPSHLNFGDGPPPTREDFVTAVFAKVRQR